MIGSKHHALTASACEAVICHEDCKVIVMAHLKLVVEKSAQMPVTQTWGAVGDKAPLVMMSKHCLVAAGFCDVVES